nr:sigma-54 dependent transcriptional regulator [Chitinivorax tropicus]
MLRLTEPEDESNLNALENKADGGKDNKVGTILIVGRGSSAAELMRPEMLGRQPAVTRLPGPVSVIKSALPGASLVVLCARAGDEEEVAQLGHWVRAASPMARLMLVADVSCEALAVTALRAGFQEYLVWPVDRLVLCQAVAGLQRPGLDMEPIKPRVPVLPSLIGQSTCMQQLRARIERLAKVDATVLLVGETGTGKDLVARHLHESSHRQGGPFVALNCAALPDGLLESELFGHERGAFTGAHQPYKGKVRLAEGGTLFLDEIGDMPLPAQAKLLRLLENREVFAIGASAVCQVNIRLVAATNHQLEHRVADGLFRQDLYYRLNVARLLLPTLRQRREDIEALAHGFLQDLANHHHQPPCRLTVAARQALMRYSWPGNVRELRNVLESAVLMAERDVIDVGDLGYLAANQVAVQDEHATHLEERTLLLRTLNQTRWNKSEAALRLNWSRMTLYRKLAKYELSPPDDGMPGVSV